MSESCREWRGDLAASALDSLDSTEQIALQAHLDGCAPCRTELKELREVAGALPAADPAQMMTRTEPPAALGERVLGRLAWQRASDRKHRRHRRVAMSVASAAAAIIVIVGVFTAGASLSHGGRPSAHHVVFSTAPKGVQAAADLRQGDYGTEVALHVKGLDDGGWYWLWLTGQDGKRVAAGTFWAREDKIDVDMTSALPLDATRRVWVTDDNNAVVLDTGMTLKLAAARNAY